VPWSETNSTEGTARKTGEASTLLWPATFDKNAAKINEEISCHVKAERVGFSGYGMLLAEIGLPPAPMSIALRSKVR